MSKTLHRSQAASPLSQVPPHVCQDTNRTAELNLRSGLEQISLFGRALCWLRAQVFFMFRTQLQHGSLRFKFPFSLSPFRRLGGWVQARQ